MENAKPQNPGWAPFDSDLHAVPPPPCFVLSPPGITSWRWSRPSKRTAIHKEKDGSR